MSNLGVKPISSFARRTAKWVFDSLPSWELKKGKVLNGIKWAGQHISSPQNRVILGATALMTQPFIDLHNRHVDDDTKKVSAARTTAKIIAGTATGYFVRYYSIKAVEKFTQKPDKAKTMLESILYPRLARTTLKGMKQYKLALGTFLSLGVMLFTNFAIDAPLTKVLTNIFVKKIKDCDRKKIESELIKPQPSVETKDALPKGQENSTQIPYIPRPSIDSLINHDRKTGYSNYVSMKGNSADNVKKEPDKQTSSKRNIIFAAAAATLIAVGAAIKGLKNINAMPKKFNSVLSAIYKAYNKDAGKMLIHTGTIGWILSSAAQIAGIMMNDKIPKEQKMFLIPQEFMDACMNIASFYLVTRSFTAVAGKLVNSGKWIPSNVKNNLIMSGFKDKIGKYDFNIIHDVMMNRKNMHFTSRSRRSFELFANGLGVVATTIGSIISCNIITPILRNLYASHRQQANLAKLNNPNPSLQNPQTPKERAKAAIHKTYMQAFMNRGT